MRFHVLTFQQNYYIPSIQQKENLENAIFCIFIRFLSHRHKNYVIMLSGFKVDLQPVKEGN